MKFITLLLLSFFLSFAGAINGIDASAAKELVDAKKAVLIDVREEAEVKPGMAKGAIFLPLSKMNNDRAAFDKIIGHIPKSKTIIVYCASGRRAQLAGIEIEKKGHKVLSMGAFSSWRDAGFPIELH